MILARGN